MGNKLLLADDSITIQKVVGIIFANEEYELTIVDNGTAAIDKASEVMPDVMLVDAIMPGKTGYEVSQAIRNDPKLRHTPILLLTGAFEPFDENQARSSGIDDYIAKPFESQHLIEKVQKLLLLGKERAVSAPAPSAPAPSAPAPSAPPPPAAPAPEQKPAAAAADPWQDFTFDTPAAVPSTAPAASDAFPVAEESEEAFTVEMTEETAAATPADDLWGAFELEEVSETEEADFGVVEIDEAAPSAVGAETDPFSFSMEDDVTPAEETAPETETFSGAVEGSWHEEEAFSFAEEPEPAPVSIEEEFAVETFSIEPEPVEETEAPEPVASTAREAAPAAYAAAPSGAMTLSEEQLAGLVAKISRDIVEKIAWEVVPDLAEALIKEEIRKIKEGR